MQLVSLCLVVLFNGAAVAKSLSEMLNVYSIPRRMISYIVLGHYPVTNSNGTQLKLNNDFNCCKTAVFKFLWSLKG